MTTDTIEVRLGQRTGPTGPVPTFTVNGIGPVDADQAIDTYRKAGRPDVAAQLERFLSAELAAAIHPARKTVQAPEPIAEPAKAAIPDERPIVIRFEMADGVRVVSMPDRVTSRTVQRDKQGRLEGSVDVERDA